MALPTSQTTQDRILVKMPNGSFTWLKGGVLVGAPTMPPVQAPQDTTLQDKARHILSSAGLSIPNDLRARAEAFVMSYLKGIRDAVETREALQKQISEGGLGFTDTQVQTLLGVLQGKGLSKKVESVVLPKAAPKPVIQKVPVAPPLALPVVTAAPMLVRSSLPPAPALPQASIIKTPVVSKSVPPKPPMLDVRPPVPLVSPAGELALRLVDFRRMANDPAKVCNIILDKLKQLEESSFSERMEGIASWRQSEVFGLYSAIVQESLVRSMPPLDIIAQHRAAGETTLTTDEFNAVVELNKKLRF